MDTHKNALLTPRGREAMARGVVEGGLSKAAAARQFNTTPKTVGKWIARFQAEGPAGLMDRSSRPPTHRQARQVRPPAKGLRLCAGSATPASRSLRKSASRSPPSVASSNAWASIGCRRSSRPSRSAAMNARRPARSPTSTFKKLGKFNRIGHRITGDRIGQSNTRGVGWEYVHLAIDDHSRLAYSKILPDEKRTPLPALSLQRHALLSKPRRQGRTRHDRQRLKLSLTPLRQGSPPAPGQAPKDQTLHAQDQRKGRALRPEACASGPMREPTTHPTNTPPNCPSGFTATTGAAPHGSPGAKPPISKIALTKDTVLSLHS